MCGVDLIRLGRAYRAIRVHLDLRQGDIAERAGVSQAGR
jgi:predicted transcriptional regulator